MRPCLRTVVETKHRCHDTAQIVGYADRAGAAAVLADRMVLVLLELHIEGRLELRDGAAQHDGARGRVVAHDTQPMLRRERLQHGDVRGRCAEPLRQFVA